MTPEQRRALDLLTPSLDEGTYLAGGVAIALRLRHRESRDLDLFVPHDFDAERWAERLPENVEVTGRARATLHVQAAGVPVSILSYRYPLLATPDRSLLSVPVASLDDLLCMKLSAIAGRGAAKDFWDLDALLEHGVAQGTLSGALELYKRKFSSEDLGHVVRSLAYFGDADRQPLPMGLTREHWSAVKRGMLQRVREL
jgi:hypothetical protein